MATSSHIAIETRSLTKAVSSGGETLNILNQVQLQIHSGQAVAIVGRSGSGKTTLLSILAGLDSPTSGDVVLLGQSLPGLDEDARARLRAGRVGFVFQSFQLLAGFTALENVMLPAELAGRRDAAALARGALDAVGLAARTHHYPHQLSGGEQQRVALARAFAGQPAILFADEPTGNLDAHTGAQVVDLLFRLNREHGATLVLVTHDLQLAARCQRTLVLKDGTIEEQALRAPAEALS